MTFNSCSLICTRAVAPCKAVTVKARCSVTARQPQKQPAHVPSWNKQACSSRVLVKDTPPKLSLRNMFHIKVKLSQIFLQLKIHLGDLKSRNLDFLCNYRKVFFSFKDNRRYTM